MFTTEKKTFFIRALTKECDFKNRKLQMNKTQLKVEC